MKGKGYDIKGKVILELNNKEGKEYYCNGQIIFIGEYYDGRRWNGNIYNYQGKEINEVKYGKWEVNDDNINKLKYEGKFLNDMKNGKGREYYERSDLTNNGLYLSNKKKQTEYDENGSKKEKINSDNELIYSGTFLKGKRWNGFEYMLTFKTEYNKEKQIIKESKVFCFEYIKGKDLLFEGDIKKGKDGMEKGKKN